MQPPSTASVPSTNGLKLYTSRYTPPCRAVSMLAAHLNIHMEEIPTRTYIDTRTEKFKKLNPCHNVPVLDDNGFILWESRVIMQYLCNKFAPKADIYPSDPKKRAVVDRLLYFDLKTLSNAVFEVHYNFTFPNEYSASRANNLMAVTQALTLLEIFLINKNYMACDHLTIADLSILASITLLEVAAEFDFTSYPNIWNWYNRLRTELPYYDRQTEIVHGELKEIIRSIRDKHEDWVTPLHRCAFTPGGNGSDKCKEEREQYKRLFLNKNEQNDAAKIMAAVRPAVFRQPFHNVDTCRNSNCHSPASFTDQVGENGETVGSSGGGNSETLGSSIAGSDSGSVSGQSVISRKKSVSRMSTCSQESHDSCEASSPRSSAMKRIKLTIEPSATETLPLGFLESPQIGGSEPKWISAPGPSSAQSYSPNVVHEQPQQNIQNMAQQNMTQQNMTQQNMQQNYIQTQQQYNNISLQNHQFMQTSPMLNNSPQMQYTDYNIWQPQAQYQQHNQYQHMQQQQQQPQYNMHIEPFIPEVPIPDWSQPILQHQQQNTFCENYNQCNQVYCDQC